MSCVEHADHNNPPDNPKTQRLQTSVRLLSSAADRWAEPLGRPAGVTFCYRLLCFSQNPQPRILFTAFPSLMSLLIGVAVVMLLAERPGPSPWRRDASYLHV